MNVQDRYELKPSPGHPAVAPTVSGNLCTSASIPVLWLLALIASCTAIFIHKAVHIDDTLFIRLAQQIQKHPTDFFGFQMNWYGASTPMIEHFNNPPLTGYYLAFLGAIFGWHEWALHLGFMLPALAASAGTYRLASYYSKSPFLAATAAVLTPVFVISSTTLMCDVLVVAFWVWALVYFEAGFHGPRLAWAAAGCLAGVAFLTKYSALSLVPLFLAYGFFRQRGLGFWLISAALPVIVAVGFECLTFHLYGKGLLLASFNVASGASHSDRSLDKAFVALNFLGGCFLPALFYSPWLWSARTFIKGFCLLAVPIYIYPYVGSFAILWNPDGSPDWLLCVQSLLFIASGIHILFLAGFDLWEHRDSPSLLLCLWVFGVFAFAGLCNWTINGRALLPIAPGLGILLARRWERAHPNTNGNLRLALLAPGMAAAALSLAVARADYALAATGRTAAHDVCSHYGKPGHKLWFEGHWGFQYYMEEQGATALDRVSSRLQTGDVIAIPSEAVNLFDLPTNSVSLVETFEYRPNRIWSTMNTAAGAGFYAAKAGAFPYLAGYTGAERYYIFQVTNPFQTGESRSGKGALLQQFDFEHKAMVCEKVLRKNPRLIEPQLGLAAIAQRQRRPEEAVEYCQAVLRVVPDSDKALNQLAWIRATSHAAEFRNGSEAVRLAERADQLTGHRSAAVVTTLGAAYAENGRFGEAILAGEQAVKLALQANQMDLVQQNERLLPLYRANQPCRD